MLNRTEKLNPILATMLIISLTLYYFIFVANTAITYAIDMVKTNSHNVDFSAYFVNENGEKVDNISKSIDSVEYLYVDIDVKNEGYFDGEIEIQNGNFTISEEILSNNISKIEGNKVVLKQINSGNKVTIKLAIEAIKNNQIKISNLNQKTNIALTGKYLNSKNIEKQDNVDVNGNTNIEINWISNENTTANLNANILTNYVYNEKKTIQILVESNITSNSYPVKNTEINLTVPENVKSVKVHSRENNATNSNVIFDETNYTYIENEKILKINVANNDENLISWNKDVKDIFVITYVFEKSVDINENITVNSAITTYDNKVLTANKTVSIGNENIDGIVSFEVDNKEQAIYKGKIYTGEERDYLETIKVNVDYIDEINEIKFNADSSKYYTQNKDSMANIFYKEIKINKNQFLSLFGNEGIITFKTLNGEEIAKITCTSEQDENGDIVITFSNEIKELSIITSEPIAIGEIKFNVTKKIINSDYEREFVKEIKGIETSYVGSYNNKEFLSEKKQIELKDTESTAKLTVNEKTFYEEDKNKKLKITATLLNNDESKELYKNPEINILLPNELNINSAKCKLLYGNGLKIESATLNNDKENNSIKIKLSGEQAEYNTEIVEGTKVVIYADVTVKNIIQDIEDKVIMSYSNDFSTIYKDNGIQEKNIKLVAATNEENAENISNEKIKNLKSSLKAYVGGEEIKDGDKVYAGEIITYELKLENVGKEAIENLKIEAIIPENTTLISYNPNYPGTDEYGAYTNDENYFIEKENNLQTINIDSNNTRIIRYMLKIDSNINQQINLNFEIGIKDNNIELQKIKATNIIIFPANVEIVAIPLCRPTSEELNVGQGYKYIIQVKNLTNMDLSHVKMQLYNNYLVDISDVYYSFEEDDEATENGRVDLKDSVFEIESIPANKTINILVNFSVNSIKNNDNTTEFMIKVEDNQANIYRSNYITEKVIGEQLEIEMNSQVTPNREESTVCVGDTIKYTIKAKNVGKNDINQVKIEDQFSNYLNLVDVTLDDKTCEYEQISQEEQEYEYLNVNIPLKAGEEKTIEIISSVKELYNDQAINIINKAAIYTENAKIDETSEIIYKVINESNIKEEQIDEISKNNSGTEENNNKKDEDKSNDNQSDNKNDNQIDDQNDEYNNTKNNKYKISGMAWLDLNENGARDKDEKSLEKISVKALNINNNEIKETKTLDDGKYSFDNLGKGEYIIIFEYDKSKYYLTAYKADEIDSKFNSDVELTDLKINGSIENVAATDTLFIEDENQENIDIGLIEAKTFDLKLDKTISKLTISNAEGTKVQEYNDVTLAQKQIRAKYISGTTVVIEYKIKITNVGEAAGYAKQIVDYKPNDLVFNSSLNSEWYQSGNNLYSTALADIELEQGESKELKLILTKTLTESNLGLIHNTAEITESFNSHGIKDKDSISENKNDIGNADFIISVSTGVSISYAFTVMIIIISISLGVYMIGKKVL